MGVQGIQVRTSATRGPRAKAVKAVRYPRWATRGWRGRSRASDYGKIPLREHMERSNREITLAVMIEDLPALADIDAIASTEGIDIVAVGPVRHVPALGSERHAGSSQARRGRPPRGEAVRKGGVARLALPMGHAALPRNAAELRSSAWLLQLRAVARGRMLKSMQAQVAEARGLLGR
jgi:4-hydroxy-2-oxoheptanedioate aldolase